MSPGGLDGWGMMMDACLHGCTIGRVVKRKEAKEREKERDGHCMGTNVDGWMMDRDQKLGSLLPAALLC